MAATIAENGIYQNEYGILRNFGGQRADLGGWYWLFTMHRQGQKIARAFHDLDHGSPEAALAAARAYRTAFMEAFPPTTNLQQAQKIRRHNKTGVPGVCRIIAPGKNCWKASVSMNGRAHNRTFSVNLYGEEEAWRLAVAARRELLLQLNPSFVRVPQEAEEVAGTLFPDHLHEIPKPKSGKWLDDDIFRQKLAEIDAQFSSHQTRARRIYVNVNLLACGKEVRVYVSDWFGKDKFLRTFGGARNLNEAFARARAFILDSIAKVHGDQAALSFMDAYGERFSPEPFAESGQFRERLIEEQDERTGERVWRRVE